MTGIGDLLPGPDIPYRPTGSASRPSGRVRSCDSGFRLGRYCASTEQDEIDEGLEIVQRQLKSRTVKSGEEELFKARAREQGEVKIIDLITARLDTKTDSYLATLPSLRLSDVRISPELVNQHERMLTGGFYAEISLNYDAAIAQESKGRPFGVESLREIQLFKRDVLDIRADGGIVLVGNFEVDVEHQQRIGHLFGPMPPEMKDDTAFMDRIHAFLPGSLDTGFLPKQEVNRVKQAAGL